MNAVASRMMKFQQTFSCQIQATPIATRVAVNQCHVRVTLKLLGIINAFVSQRQLRRAVRSLRTGSLCAYSASIAAESTSINHIESVEKASLCLKRMNLRLLCLSQ